MDEFIKTALAIEFLNVSRPQRGGGGGPKISTQMGCFFFHFFEGDATVYFQNLQ